MLNGIGNDFGSSVEPPAGGWLLLLYIGSNLVFTTLVETWPDTPDVAPLAVAFGLIEGKRGDE